MKKIGPNVCAIHTLFIEWLMQNVKLEVITMNHEHETYSSYETMQVDAPPYKRKHF